MKNINIKTTTKASITDENICCALDMQCSGGFSAKKEWLKSHIKDGYTLKKLDEHGRFFIEYVPAEKSWVPINAANYMLINCFCVSRKYKKHGMGTALYEECLRDTYNQDRDGITIITGNSNKSFMPENRFLKNKGFLLCDTSEPYFELWYKPLKKTSLIPQFKAIAKKGICNVKEGLSVYYSNACPYTEYYVNVELTNLAKNRNIPLVINKLDTQSKAQNHFVPHTIYSLFYNGKFITQKILTDKIFDKLLKRS